jgi:predicted MPP superfamily phosphohydrolase
LEARHKKQFQTIISLYDLHYPYNINLKAVFEFIREKQPDEIILGGDMIDCEGISKFYRGSSESGLAETVEEIKGFKKILIHLKSLTPHSKIIYLLGNHEDRIK